jgi:hypothetical protein
MLERSLQASWWQEHGAAHDGGLRAQQASKLETRALFAGSQGGTVAPAGGNTCAPRSARLDLISSKSCQKKSPAESDLGGAEVPNEGETHTSLRGVKFPRWDSSAGTRKGKGGRKAPLFGGPGISRLGGWSAAFLARKRLTRLRIAWRRAAPKERLRLSGVRLLCRYGRMCTDRKQPTPKIARRKQRTRSGERLAPTC